MSEILYKDLSYRIMGAVYKVHNELGSGFLEKIYENALVNELRKNGIKCQQQFPVKVHYDGVVVGDYYADVFVDNKIILELKTVEALTDIHKAQLIHYLKATGVRLGMLINFHSQKVESIRVVNTTPSGRE